MTPLYVLNVVLVKHLLVYVNMGKIFTMPVNDSFKYLTTHTFVTRALHPVTNVQLFKHLLL